MGLYSNPETFGPSPRRGDPSVIWLEVDELHSRLRRERLSTCCLLGSCFASWSWLQFNARIANCELQRRKWLAVNGSTAANGPVIQTEAIYPQRLLEFYFHMFSSKQVSDPEPTQPYYTTSHSCRAAVHGLVHRVTDESPVAELCALLLTPLAAQQRSRKLSL
ncbi:uncharacterized protein LOC118178463 [Oxyura jamaicensis]|uniref:uncharacterized protein LOC118178463 n=1 Tax=Oxyura jamaicensis TaxID=8884 RepID=UPI0015A558CC|nr:uncharacterized protein LOC118178463 [Oxyura jamaicensis]